MRTTGYYFSKVAMLLLSVVLTITVSRINHRRPFLLVSIQALSIQNPIQQQQHAVVTTRSRRTRLYHPSADFTVWPTHRRTITSSVMMSNIPPEDDNRSTMMNSNTASSSTSTTTFRPETNFGSENVPVAQRPINEYLDVTNQPFFTWARDSTTNIELFMKFLGCYTFLFLVICYPISGATFTQDEGYMLHKLLSSNVGAMFVTMLLLLRVYTGYEYIGQRLQSKYIEYEETGWYDGDVEIKTKTELLRDRMLYTSQVQPIVDRLKSFMIVGTTYLMGSILLLNIVLTNKPIVFDQYDPDVLSRLSYDDKLADSAAINTNGKPAYCDSRYYRAIANGGLGCNN